jgi:hypothetical protein
LLQIRLDTLKTRAKERRISMPRKKIDETAVEAVVNETPIVTRKPRKPKLVEVQPDQSDLEDDQIENAKYVLATEQEAATLGSDEPSGVEIQLGLLTARIEELNALVRNLAKKVEERGGDSRPPRRDDRPSGDRQTPTPRIWRQTKVRWRR